ncbi:hypothetical protein DsansV1_C04g0037881 [Dioscorea sansibarensis]
MMIIRPNRAFLVHANGFVQVDNLIVNPFVYCIRLSISKYQTKMFQILSLFAD